MYNLFTLKLYTNFRSVEVFQLLEIVFIIYKFITSYKPL